MDTLRILIVADDPLARAGLAALLAPQEEFVIVGQIDSDDPIAARTVTYRPDVLLWDLGWDATAGLTALDELELTTDRTQDPAPAPSAEPPVVALLADPDDGAAAWQAGVSGLLPRAAGIDELAAALRAVGNGLLTVDPTFATVLSLRGGSDDAPVEALTPRELEVLQLLAEGLPNKTIARELEISEHTVKFHVNAIMSKFNAASRTEAVVRATRAGLILL